MDPIRRVVVTKSLVHPPSERKGLFMAHGGASRSSFALVCLYAKVLSMHQRPTILLILHFPCAVAGELWESSTQAASIVRRGCVRMSAGWCAVAVRVWEISPGDPPGVQEPLGEDSVLPPRPV